MSQKGIKANFKFWLETEDGYVFGEGPFELLSRVRELGTLAHAAKALNMSYRHAWGAIRTVETRLGIPVMTRHKGGARGGGGAELTKEGYLLIDEYYRLKEAYSRASQALETENDDRALCVEGYARGRVLRVWEEKPTMAEVEMEGGDIAKFLIGQKKDKEDSIAVGDRLRFNLKDIRLPAENE